jgi:hypothetical protein
MFDDVFSWWLFLCVVGAVNVTAWSISAGMVRRRHKVLPAETYLACRKQLLLSAVYVFGCAFRAALPVFDVPRITLFDTWLSSIIVGRSVATLAELCFVAQWALMLRQTAKAAGSDFALTISRSILPLIAVAEICSWYSVLTTNNIGHVLEETIWGASAALVVISLSALCPRCPARWRPALVTAAIAGTGYAAYMFLVDVPMYWARWLNDESHGKQYLSLIEGVFDTAGRRIVTHQWEVWQGEMVWMSLYFSIAVWISISLVHASFRRILPTARRQ